MNDIFDYEEYGAKPKKAPRLKSDNPRPTGQYGWARIHFDDLQTGMNLGSVANWIIYHGQISGSHQIWWCEQWTDGKWRPVRQDDLPKIDTDTIATR